MTTLISHSVISPTSLGEGVDLESVVCDYCGQDQADVIASLPPVSELPMPMHRLGASALNLRERCIHFCACRMCGLIYMNPRLTESAIARFYDTIYSIMGASIAFESDQRARVDYILDVIARLLTNHDNPRVLDIGCGAGQFLYGAQQRGWTVAGAELSQVAAQQASERLGTPIFCGDFRAMNLPLHAFDVVTIQSTVEHLRAPIDYLCDAAALLRPGGVLFFDVPNVASTEHRAAKLLGQQWRGFTIEHLYYFTPGFLRRLTAGLGLELVVMSSWNPMAQWPNPLRDLLAIARRAHASGATAASRTAVPLPPAPTFSLGQRILRQATNYLLDTVSKLSEGRRGGSSVSGNALFVWARRPA